ncbi:MAG: zinc-binding alcohol dehydrogenase family protein [Mycobacteriales bacterium]
MRALVLTGPSATADRTEIREVAEPLPGPGEVTVEVTHAGINFKEVMQRRGDPEWVPGWPLVPGMEVAGVVRRLGAGVDSPAPGQRVAGYAGTGGLAEVATVRADLAVPVPDEVTLRDAAAVPVVLATALILLADAGRVAAGETVLVHSAGGGVGTALARLAPLYGVARLIGTTGRADRAGAVRDAGYELALVRDGGLVDAVREVAPAGVDLILDPLGTVALDDDLAMVAPGGRIVLFGNAAGGPPELPTLYRLMAANVSIGGMAISGLVAKAPHRVAGAMRQVLDLLAAGKLAYPVTEVPLADVPGVHQALADGRGAGKYVARL